jgi:hypothetical protein
MFEGVIDPEEEGEDSFRMLIVGGSGHHLGALDGGVEAIQPAVDIGSIGDLYNQVH